MVFTVYSRSSNELIVRIIDEKVDYVAPGFAKQLEKIPTDACFSYYTPGVREKVFGKNVSEVTSNDALYPIALKMYCQAQLLTHPESYASRQQETKSAE